MASEETFAFFLMGRSDGLSLLAPGRGEAVRARGSDLHRPNLARRWGGALSSVGLCAPPPPQMS